MAVPITAPPERLCFQSLAELYTHFHSLFIGKEFLCPRGIRIIFRPHHFFHLVKLRKGLQTEFAIEEEEPLIKATEQGLGEYEINEKRAQTLSWIPEILSEPHEIWGYEKKKTADEVFIREYDKPGSPFRVVLLLREEGCLVPITCMTVRRTGIKEHRRGKRLWPKDESHLG